MIDNIFKRKTKEKELIELANMSDKKIEKLDYKEKQKCYKAKSKLYKLFHISRDKQGRGITYIKPTDEKNSNAA